MASKKPRRRRKKPSDKMPQVYRPPKWAQLYVAACLDWQIQPTKSARCEAIGIDRNTLWRAEALPEFVTWLNRTLEAKLMGENREVKTALLRKCLSGDLEAIKEWRDWEREIREKLGLSGGPVAAPGSEIPTDRQLDDLSGEELLNIAGILAARTSKGVS